MTDHSDSRRAEPRGVLRALAALGALAVLLVAVPWVLVALTGALPLDLGALAPAAWGRADDGRVLLLVMVAVAWAAWGVMVLSVGLEAWAAVRRAPTPTLPGLAFPQRVAAGLVAAVLVALSPAAGGPSAASEASDVDAGGQRASVATAPAQRDPTAAVAPGGATAPLVGTAAGSSASGATTAHVAAAGSKGGSRTPAPTPAGTATGARPEGLTGEQEGGRSAELSVRPSSTRSDRAARPPRVLTQRHDTLWLLAEHHLGSGERYAEIVHLNRGVLQRDGRSLGDDGRLYPGWTLILPADATVDADRPDRHRVVRGDTLWQIAEDELGDPTRYPEIAEANRGDLQPDGRRLTDPNLILPGWVLEIPGTEDQVEAPDADAADRVATQPEMHGPVPGEANVDSPEALAPIDRGARPGASAPSAGEPASTPAPSAAESTDPNTGVPSLDRGGVARSVAESATPTPTTTPTATPTVTPSATAPATPAPTAAPATAEPTSAPREGADAEPEMPTLQPPDAAGAGFALPAGGAAAALLMAGLGAELVRRRRQFQRHRRAGEQMPNPGPGAKDVERAARAATREPGLDLLDRALAQLADSAHASGAGLPDVRLVRVGAESVTLDLASPAAPALAPFVAADDSRWVLATDLLSSEALERARALPGLATLGFAGDETVLINLESVGTLVVTGSASATGDVVRGLAAELALGPLSALTERVLCLSDPAIAGAVEAGGIGVEPDPARAAATLRAAMGRAPERSPSPSDAVPTDPSPTDPAAGDGAAGDAATDPLLIVLTDQDLGLRVSPRSGCALITTAPVVGVGATLVIHDQGAAVLLPDREALVPQHLSRTTTADMVAVLGAADLPETPPGDLIGQTSLWEPTEQPVQVIDLREIPTAPAEESSQPSLPLLPEPPTLADGPPSVVPRVLMLGEVVVENAQGRCESTRIGRLAETAAFVLLNPGARPSELQGALWPGRRSNPQTCRQMISRARTWLGRTDAGEPYLMTFAESEGRLRLRPEVGSDWADFQRLAQIGLEDPEDTAHLAQALSLVRGRPFGAVASRELPWADLHINEMVSLITDVAHALALRHEEAGRRSAACDAALRGLRTESESEVLEAVVARTRV